MIHSSLFISSFRKKKRIVRYIAEAAGIIILFLMLCKLLNHVYARAERNTEWSRRVWHDFYAQEDKIDHLFVGSSHVYWDINAPMLDEINGENNFNLSNSGQELNGSYYSIKEANRTHEITNIYFELYYAVSCGMKLKSSSNETASWRIIDCMKPSLNKVEFTGASVRKNMLLDTVFPFVRYREKLFSLSYIEENLKRKSSDDYKNFRYLVEDEGVRVTFQDKGFSYSTKRFVERELMFKKTISMDGDWECTAESDEYIRKIIEYCQNENINITLFISPIYESQLLSTEDYDAYVRYIREIAKEYDVPFYDFNLCRPEHLDMRSRDYYQDHGHLNLSGANLYTEFLWKVLSAPEEENAKYFYDTYSEKLALQEPEIFGLYYSEEEECLNLSVASNRVNGMEYRISVIPEGGSERCIQEYSENKDFLLPKQEHGIVVLEARAAEKPQEVQTLRIAY